LTVHLFQSDPHLKIKSFGAFSEPIKLQAFLNLLTDFHHANGPKGKHSVVSSSSTAAPTTMGVSPSQEAPIFSK